MSRAGMLRANEQVLHVYFQKEGGEYIVLYSVPKWYGEEMKKAGITL